MANREIITIPDPVLRQISKPVERFDDEVQKLLDDMTETMYEAPGIGLAAIQIGVPLRIFVTDIGPPIDEDDEEANAEGAETAESESIASEEIEFPKDPLFFINPEIVKVSGESSIYNEGCLSIPDYYAEVERPSDVAIKFLDREGKEQFMQVGGLQSTCIQHEFDHLDGKLFIDLISKLKRDMVVRKFTKIAKQQGNII